MINYFLQHLSHLRRLTGTYYVLLHWIIIVLISILILSWFILPYVDWRESQHTLIEQNLQKAARLQALQRSTKAWQASNVEAKAAVEKDLQGFFIAASYTQAQQELYNLINSAAEANHLKIISHSFAESSDTPIGEELSVELSIQGALADLVRIIDIFAHHQKLLSFPMLQLFKSSDGAVLQMTIAGYRPKTKAPESKT